MIPEGHHEGRRIAANTAPADPPRRREPRRGAARPVVESPIGGGARFLVYARSPSAGIGALVLAACGSPGSSVSPPPPPPPTPTTLQGPTSINLYPVTSATEGDRLFVMVTAVGANAVSLPLAFDTGSSGVTLYAPSIFPADMVGSGGFSFPSGQTSLTFNGITVTDQQGTRAFGGPNGRTQTGNIGYAQVTFGDARGSLTTDVMPVFLYYRITNTATGDAVSPPVQKGWFGVNSAPDTIAIAGSPVPAGGYPACASDTTGSCRVVSILKYLRYSSGLNAGFLLSPAPLQACDIAMVGSCAAQPMLTVGLTAALEAGFSTANLACPPGNYVGPDSIAGYPVCQASVPDTTVTVSGASAGVFTGAVLFDSGTPDMVLNIPPGTTFPAAAPSGTAVLVATPSGYSYSFTADAGAYNTIVNQNSAAPSIVGIGYFTTNFLFNDLTSSTEGWK